MGRMCLMSHSARRVYAQMADFQDTVSLSGLTVEDLSGNVVSGAQITSASGTLYGPNGVVTTPEPSSAHCSQTGRLLQVSGSTLSSPDRVLLVRAIRCGSEKTHGPRIPRRERCRRLVQL